MDDDRYLRIRLRIPRREPYLEVLALLEALPPHDRGAWLREAVLERAARLGAAPSATGTGAPQTASAPAFEPAPPPAPAASGPAAAGHLPEAVRSGAQTDPTPVPADAGSGRPPASAGTRPADPVTEEEGEMEEIPIEEMDRAELARLGGMVAAV